MPLGDIYLNKLFEQQEIYAHLLLPYLVPFWVLLQWPLHIACEGSLLMARDPDSHNKMEADEDTPGTECLLSRLTGTNWHLCLWHLSVRLHKRAFCLSAQLQSSGSQFTVSGINNGWGGIQPPDTKPPIVWAAHLSLCWTSVFSRYWDTVMVQ